MAATKGNMTLRVEPELKAQAAAQIHSKRLEKSSRLRFQFRFHS